MFVGISFSGLDEMDDRRVKKCQKRCGWGRVIFWWGKSLRLPGTIRQNAEALLVDVGHREVLKQGYSRKRDERTSCGLGLDWVWCRCGL